MKRFGIRSKAVLLALLVAGVTAGCSKEAPDAALYDGARSAISEGRYEEAVESLERLVAEFPDSDLRGEAQFLAGKTYVEHLGKPERGRSYLRAAIATDPNSALAEKSFRLLYYGDDAKDLTEEKLYSEAEQFQRMGLYDYSIRLYDKIIEDFPESERNDKAQFMIGFVCSEYLRDSARANEAYRKVLDKYPQSDLADDAQFMIESGLGTIPPPLEE